MTALTSQAVDELVRECLMTKEEDEAGEQAMRIRGIQNEYVFHEKRVFENRPLIIELLNELPEAFHEATGGGWSFLNACEDKHGIQWTGLHEMVEALFCIGMATGKVESLMPREMWAVLPGGMPYYVVKTAD